MTQKEIEKVKEEWIMESEDTNEYCERSLLLDALVMLEEDPPNIELAIKRLRSVIPVSGGAELITPPSFLNEGEF